MTHFKYSINFLVLLVYFVLVPASFISRVQGQENGALDLANYPCIQDTTDLLFPETDPLSIQVIVVSIFWFLMGLGVEFTHRYPKWHVIVDLVFIVFVVVVSLIIYQQHITGQLSPTTIFRILHYLLFLFVGAIIGYILRKLKKRENRNSCAGAQNL